MPAAATRLLAIGDIHLGRRSGRLPDGLDAARLDPAAALDLAVAAACRLKVAAVLMAGDVIDSERAPFHAIGLLAGAVATLKQHDIPVYVVAGNHDAVALPRAVDALDGLTILGQGGQWEEVTIDDAVRVRGWSFPAPRYQANPLVDFPPIETGPPVVGLLHADLGAPGSHHAPVTRGDLAGAGPVRWLLGHIHAPSLDPDDPAPGYLGSLVGLDPTETGPHGPWLVTVQGDTVQLEHLPLAPLHWTTLDVDVDAVADAGAELPALVTDALGELAAGDAPGVAEAEAVGVRLRFTGRTADLAGLEQARRQLVETGFVLPVDQQRLFVDAATCGARPLHKLSTLAATDGLPGLLARDLQALEAGDASDLLADAGSLIGSVDHQSFLAVLPDAGRGVAADRLHELVLQAGYRLLDALLDPEGAPDAPA